MIALQGTDRGKLDWVEAGRGLAATAVVISHVGTVHPAPINPALLGLLGSTGVAFFFVLSGFIMLHIHWEDIGHPATAPYFIWRRLGRILPTYYVALLIMLAVNLLLQKASSHVAVTPGFLLRQVFLAPGDELFLGPAWTLRSELFFYLIFGGLLVNVRLGIALFVAWFAAMVCHMLWFGIWTKAVNAFPDLYIHHVNLFFFEGLGVALAHRTAHLRQFIIINAAIAVLLLSLAPWSVDRGWMVALALFPTYGALLALTVTLSFGSWRAPRFFVWLGAISYSLYLIHLSVFIVLRGVDHVVGRSLDAFWPVRVALQLAIAIAVAGLLHQTFERPVLKWVAKRRVVLGINVARTRSVVAA